MAEAKKKNRWDDDTMVLVSRETRVNIKLKAAKEGRTVKEYLKRLVESSK